MVRTLLLAAGLALVVAGCGRQFNRAPVITRLVGNPNPVTFSSQGRTTIEAQATDPDRDVVRFTWTANGGTFANTEGDRVLWYIEPCCPDGEFLVTVRADDGRGGVAEASLTILVR
jgi:hypothetical protein